jgi:hypothetical protein
VEFLVSSFIRSADGCRFGSDLGLLAHEFGFFDRTFPFVVFSTVSSTSEVPNEAREFFQTTLLACRKLKAINANRCRGGARMAACGVLSLSSAAHGRCHLRQEPDAGHPLVGMRGEDREPWRSLLRSRRRPRIRVPVVPAFPFSESCKESANEKTATPE